MDAIFYDDRHLVKKKFPNVLFKKFCDPKDTIKLVVDPCLPTAIEDRDEEMSSVLESNVAETEPTSSRETKAQPESSSRAAESSKAQIRHPSGARTQSMPIVTESTSKAFFPRPPCFLRNSTEGTYGRWATRPLKPLPRCARKRSSISVNVTMESTSTLKDEGGPVADILSFLSTGPNRLYNPDTKKWANWPKTYLPGAEENVAAYLNKVVASARLFLNNNEELKEVDDDWVFSSRNRNTPVKSDGAELRSDIAIVPRIHAGAERSGHWVDIRAIGEIKSDRHFSLSDIVGDFAEYARLCFGHQRARRFVLGFSLLDTKMRLWKFDRSGVLVSHQFDVHEKPLDFLRVILGLIVGDDYYIGLDPSFIHEGDKDCIMLNDKRYKIKETIHLDSVVCGRGTVVLLVEDDAGELLVMKDQWVERTREVKEFTTLDIVKDVKGVASLKDYQLVHFKVGNEVVRDSTEDDRSSEELRHKVESRGIEIRDHYRLLMKPYGKNLEDFKSLKELISVFRDYMQVIKDLLERDVVHRDISPRNVIIVEVEGELLRRGFLIDFDYATIRSRQTPAKAERTGTLPFMAVDILQGEIQKHDFYHDVESLFYVLIWTCLTQNGPDNEPRPASEFKFKDSALYFWCCGGDGDETAMTRVGLSKQAIILGPSNFERLIIGCLPKYFQPLTVLLHDLRDIIFHYPECLHEVALKNENDSEEQNANRSKEALKRKREDLDAIIELLQTTLNELPDEEQLPVASDEQLKRSLNPPRVDIIQAGSKTRVMDQVPDTIRPCDCTNMTSSERTSLEGPSELLGAGVTNSANQFIALRGEKRSYDEEPMGAPAPKRLRRSPDNE